MKIFFYSGCLIITLTLSCAFRDRLENSDYPPCTPDGRCPENCTCLAGKVCVPDEPGKSPQFCARCPEGFADCDGDPKTGCETNTNTDPAHCGDCQTICPAPETSCDQAGDILKIAYECRQGKCTKTTGSTIPCESQCTEENPCSCFEGKCLRRVCGETRCAESAWCLEDEGICYCGSLQSPVICGKEQMCCAGVCLTVNDENCTGCGQGCAAPRHCELVETGKGECFCPAGYEECNPGLPDCDTDISTNPNCGACGNDCGSVPCVVDSGYFYCDCPPDRANCDFTIPGCETNITSNPNCGGCGNDCGNQPCSFDGQYYYCECPPGWGNCDWTEPGCETDITSNPNCGACGNDCGNQPCSFDGQYYYCECPPGWGNCDWTEPGCETDITRDPNCGWCGNQCQPPQKCCIGTCVDLNIDTSNCGACGNTCLAGICKAGWCGSEGVFCFAPFDNCPAGMICCFRPGVIVEGKCFNANNADCSIFGGTVQCDDRLDCRGKYCCLSTGNGNTNQVGTFCRELPCSTEELSLCASDGDCDGGKRCLEKAVVGFGQDIILRVCLPQ